MKILSFDNTRTGTQEYDVYSAERDGQIIGRVWAGGTIFETHVEDLICTEIHDLSEWFRENTKC